jgi:hypothetical protein
MAAPLLAPPLSAVSPTRQDYLPLALLSPCLPGLPRGGLSTVFGARSSGQTAFRDAVLAAATRRGEHAALADLGDHFDPQAAAQAGVVLRRLVWVRGGGNIEHALKAADLLLHGGGFGVVCLDLGEAPAPELNRIPISYWFRFRAAVQHTPTVFLLMSRQPLAVSCAACRIEFRRRGILWSGEPPFRLLRGLRIEALARKPGPERPLRWEAEAE